MYILFHMNIESLLTYFPFKTNKQPTHCVAITVISINIASLHIPTFWPYPIAYQLTGHQGLAVRSVGGEV